MVWLDTDNLKTKWPKKKLDYKRIGPFKIAKKVSTHAYKLKLPLGLKAIHDVFHVNLLSKHHMDEFRNKQEPPPPPIEVEDNDLHYEVETILHSRLYGRSKRAQFLIRWKGYGPEDDTWEFMENLEGSTEILRNFQQNHPNKPSESEERIHAFEREISNRYRKPLIEKQKTKPEIEATVSKNMPTSTSGLRRSTRIQNKY